ncbi:hypothetical protein [Flaviaesturariibacter terrae]
MTPEETRFQHIGASIPGAEKGQLFGKPCFKMNGKAFTCFFQNEMVFKLTGPAHAAALAVAGARLFDPSGKGRPMKEWVQVPTAGDWERMARVAAGIE